MPRKKTSLELRVLFDTNVLYSQIAHNLLRTEVVELIKANSQHPDLSIQWLLPDVVVDERRYQMQRKAFDLLPSLEKLEALLGHNLNITEEVLLRRVDEAINKQIDELGISVRTLDTNTIDWAELINRAVFRQPPFDPGEKEKGFRDSLIAEGFLQLITQSPATPTVCRCAIVSNDDLLSKYLRQCTKDAKNVRVLADIGELESLINTLVSTVTEEFVVDLTEKANNYFFVKDNDQTLYYKEDVGPKILDLYGEELDQVPRPELIRDNGTWWISQPVFVRKERQRVFWITSITVDAKLSKHQYPKSNFVTQPLGLGYSGTGTTQTTGLPGLGRLSTKTTQTTAFPGLGGLLAQAPNKVEVANGQTIFEVFWSVSVTQRRRLTSPQIEEIRFISTKWSDE